MLAAGQHAAQQDRGIDGRDLRIPNPFTRLLVREMIEESTVVGHRLPEKPKRGNHAIARILEGHVAALLTDAEGGQSETSGRDACHDPRVRLPNMAAVFHQAGLSIPLLPEVLEVRSFDLLQKNVIFGRERGGGGLLRRARHGAEGQLPRSPQRTGGANNAEVGNLLRSRDQWRHGRHKPHNNGLQSLVKDRDNKRRKTFLWIAIAAAALVVVVVVWRSRTGGPHRSPIQTVQIRGAVLRQNKDPRKQAPIANAAITTTGSLFEVTAKSDASGFFQLFRAPGAALHRPDHTYF